MSVQPMRMKVIYSPQELLKLITADMGQKLNKPVAGVELTALDFEGDDLDYFSDLEAEIELVDEAEQCLTPLLFQPAN